MKLKIVTPLSILLEQDIDLLRAEDPSGSFGIMPSHVPFMTALAISIVSWRRAQEEQFCAVRGGVLIVSGGDVTCISIATREAVVGSDLAKLGADVLAYFQSEADAERVDHIQSVQLQLNAIRRMVNRLQPAANTGALR